jgi:AraC family transcriptional regulator of adaptative response / DNA-3-methyladenine glycosylase II
VINGRIPLDARADGRAAVAALTALPGIGAWTAEYIAMRALGEPDAFPTGDLVLRRAAGHLSARALDRRSEAWRPWRAYAVMLLWQAAAGPDPSRRVKNAQSIGASYAGNRRSPRLPAGRRAGQKGASDQAR